MITCDACGATNEAGAQFCGTCGEFLWSRSGPDQPSEAVDREPTRTPPEERGRATATTDGPPAAAEPKQAGNRAPVDTDAGGPGDQRPPARTATTDSQRGDSAPRPRHPDDGPADARDPRSTRPDPPKPVQPGAPKPVQPGPPEPGPVSDDGSPRPPDTRVTCPNPACGAQNDPGRRFCLRCGEPLVAAPVATERKRTWWQRLWDRLRRRTPRHRRSLRYEERRVGAAARRTLLIVLAVCLVAVLAVVGPPLARRAVEAVRDRTQDPTPLVPASVVASSEAPGAGASRLTDGASNRYWAPAGKATDSWVEGRFNEPVRLLTVVITPGVSPRRQAYLAAGRPRELTVVTVNADGEEQSTDIELVDEPGEQHFDVSMPDLVRIRLVVRSTYGPGLIPAVAIGEAEFFGRR
ncbi:zinc ribbon domain-containing protein [Micromonospora qiuiae]|uniref:Zinc ribbon domain-containing protein n=1 Tax=Micromonospora qiuiae TaxID=502268 RepID=A0ABQ4J9P4_9ACTN|nr:zinc ribbon domain-containing protein [Micromonospora qiuiae]GIJ26808.1 zinc ribbon domain-containing protein [Micromonospora qiuiae]